MLATALLIVMVVLFVATSAVGGQNFATLLVRLPRRASSAASPTGSP